jgi:hypothetical protein
VQDSLIFLPGGVQCHKQGIEPSPGCWSKALEHGCAEAFLVCGDRGSQEAFEPIGRRRLDPQALATLEDGGLRVGRITILGEDLCHQPGLQSPGVLQGPFTEAKQGADLGPVILVGATFPVIRRPLGRRYADLRREVGHDDTRYFQELARKPALELEELQKHGEAETGGSTLVGQRVPLLGTQGPELGELVVGPRVLHAKLLARTLAPLYHFAE